ncbi:hypothetical protein NFHSH190041_37160 (plasmid) [Shewanella sp. NFH-SH190041]|uniref:hypothetical protein n=1 Tax=Shewanella sp. NFH-SH190041 TaxID=2950245 RepID=UPI0021C4806A|nr:hypothetical protein [Shewanella sp. NFH-SH190041]BDM66264.1 hypothetical protein NFHSH190041_37160 [Shewanella sp. NFH-SH190041]
MALAYSKNKTLKDVVEDGFKNAQENDCEGFEYIIGKIRGGELKVVFEPDASVSEAICTDGVDGFGYCLVFEE